MIDILKSSDIQSIRFAKSKFTRTEAVSWAKSHGFKSSDVEETPNQYRLRQFPPTNCLRSGGIKEISDGVQAYICPIKSSKAKDGIPQSSGSVDFVPTEQIMSVGEDDFDYIIPITINDLKEGHIVEYKDKIGKIIKVINSKDND